MSDTVKAAVIIGVCLMLGLWGAGWLNRIPEEFTINDLGKLNIQAVDDAKKAKSGADFLQKEGFSETQAKVVSGYEDKIKGAQEKRNELMDEMQVEKRNKLRQERGTLSSKPTLTATEQNRMTEIDEQLKQIQSVQTGTVDSDTIFTKKELETISGDPLMGLAKGGNKSAQDTIQETIKRRIEDRFGDSLDENEKKGLQMSIFDKLQQEDTGGAQQVIDKAIESNIKDINDLNKGLVDIGNELVGQGLDKAQIDKLIKDIKYSEQVLKAISDLGGKKYVDAADVQRPIRIELTD